MSHSQLQPEPCQFNYKMSQRQGEYLSQRISRKTGTPYFGALNENRDSIWLVQNQQNSPEPVQPPQRSYPQTILQLSSNSSDTNQLVKTLRYRDDNENTDIELVYVKDEGQLQRPKRIKGDKSKSDFKVAGVVDGEGDGPVGKATEKVTSSWGVPTSLEYSRKKTVLDEKEAEVDCKIYKNGGWTKTILMLTQTKLSFFQFSFEIEALQKIKILPFNSPTKTRPQNIIKILFNKQVQLFTLTMDKKSYDVPFSYYLFAKLIQKRLHAAGQTQDMQWQKSQHAEKRATSDSYIYGNILKRSQHLGNWESRFVVVKRDGIYSYKNSLQEENYSFYISSQSVKYIWTRFEKIDGHLIVKIKHGIFKTEFGIPLTMFSGRGGSNWLYAFYRTLPVSVPVNVSPIK